MYGKETRLTIVKTASTWEFSSTRACFFHSVAGGTTLLDTDSASHFAIRFTVKLK